MTKFEIEISRGILRVEKLTVQVDAETLEQAKKKAISKSKKYADDNWIDCTWDGYDSEWNYQIESSHEIKEQVTA